VRVRAQVGPHDLGCGRAGERAGLNGHPYESPSIRDDHRSRRADTEQASLNAGGPDLSQADASRLGHKPCS
jgi:hypothetical protein